MAAARGDGTGDLAVTGEAITTAARIQALARPGEILLDEATVRGGRDRLTVDDRGSVVLRGQSSVVRLFSLTGQSGLTGLGAHRATPENPLVGRVPEMGRVRRTLKRARRSGRGAVVLITGDAGMGKSRIVADLEGEARGLGYAWTWTESVSYGRGEPYRFARLFAQAIADEHEIDSGSYTRQLLFTPGTDEATLRRYGGAIAAVARDAAFSGWEAEQVDVPDDPSEIAAVLGEVAAAYIERVLDTDGPRVVVLDDLHWLDTSSGGMVELLVATAAVRPLVILATTRPGIIPDWASLEHVERVDLGGLAPAETAQLATIVARAALDAGDARRIHERTQGNPLFIGETVRASIEDGTLELRDGRMVLVEPGAPRLPLTLRAVLGARLDGLDEPARDVLSVASVVGIGFRPGRAGGSPRGADRARDPRPARRRRPHRPRDREREVAVQPPAGPRDGVRRDAGIAPAAPPRPAGRPTGSGSHAGAGRDPGHPPCRVGRCGGCHPAPRRGRHRRPRDGGAERGGRLLAERRRSGHRTGRHRRSTAPQRVRRWRRRGARRPARPRARPRPAARRSGSGPGRPGGSTGLPPRTGASSSARRSGG